MGPGGVAALAADGDDHAVWGLEGNVLSRSAYSRGDVEAAFAASAHVVRETFTTQRVEHAFLEPESTLAVPGGWPTTAGGSAPAHGPLHVYSGGQGVWDDRDQIASILAVGTEEVVVELVSNGGAFGSRYVATDIGLMRKHGLRRGATAGICASSLRIGRWPRFFCSSFWMMPTSPPAAAAAAGAREAT